MLFNYLFTNSFQTLKNQIGNFILFICFVFLLKLMSNILWGLKNSKQYKKVHTEKFHSHSCPNSACSSLPSICNHFLMLIYLLNSFCKYWQTWIYITFSLFIIEKKLHIVLHLAFFPNRTLRGSSLLFL